MSKSSKRGLGSFFYTEWLRIPHDYLCSLKRNEFVFEIVFPLIVAVACAVLYYYFDSIQVAIDKLSNILPTILAVMIGFTIMLVTQLTSGSNDNLNKLKEKELSPQKILYSSPMSLYQCLYIQFCNSLISEITLLAIVFISMFVKPMFPPTWLLFVIFFIEVYFVANILLTTIRGVSNFYVTLYKV